MNFFDAANNYEEMQKLGNIADLECVEISEEMEEKTYGEGEKAFTNVVITRDAGTDTEKDYRIPKTVLGALKVQLRENPDLKKFKVVKEGTTVNDTKYFVIPL